VERTAGGLIASVRFRDLKARPPTKDRSDERRSLVAVLVAGELKGRLQGPPALVPVRLSVRLMFDRHSVSWPMLRAAGKAPRPCRAETL
jgi:hypothetical protein